MNQREQLELLRAAVAVALADGELRRSEKGVIRGLACRVGIGQTTFDAMVEAAEQGHDVADAISINTPESARTAMELLVALARIDGQISDDERDVIVRIATSMGITGDDFGAVYQAGIERADRLRGQR